MNPLLHFPLLGSKRRGLHAAVEGVVAFPSIDGPRSSTTLQSLLYRQPLAPGVVNGRGRLWLYEGAAELTDLMATAAGIDLSQGAPELHSNTPGQGVFFNLISTRPGNLLAADLYEIAPRMIVGVPGALPHVSRLSQNLRP